MDIATPSEGVSPVLTIFLFIFLLLGAIGVFIFQENQKRAGVAASEKVNHRHRIGLCLQLYRALHLLPSCFSKNDDVWRARVYATNVRCSRWRRGLRCRHMRQNLPISSRVCHASVTTVHRSIDRSHAHALHRCCSMLLLPSSCRRRSCRRRRWLARRARTARNSPVSAVQRKRMHALLTDTDRCGAVLRGCMFCSKTLTLSPFCTSLCVLPCSLRCAVE